MSQRRLFLLDELNEDMLEVIATVLLVLDDATLLALGKQFALRQIEQMRLLSESEKQTIAEGKKTTVALSSVMNSCQFFYKKMRVKRLATTLAQHVENGNMPQIHKLQHQVNLNDELVASLLTFPCKKSLTLMQLAYREHNVAALTHFKSLQNGSALLQTQVSQFFRESYGKSNIPENLFDELVSAILADENIDAAADTFRKNIKSLVNDTHDLFKIIFAATNCFRSNTIRFEAVETSAKLFNQIVFGSLERESRGWLRQNIADGVHNINTGMNRQVHRKMFKLNDAQESISSFLDEPGKELGFTFFVDALGSKATNSSVERYRKDDLLSGQLDYMVFVEQKRMLELLKPQ